MIRDPTTTPSSAERKITRLEVDPSRCRVWRLQSHLQDSLAAERAADVTDVVTSIRQFGQFMPAIVRPVTDDPRYSHEIVDGFRRRLACEQLRRKLVVDSEEMTDLRAAMIVQAADSPGKHTPYEVGLRWQSWLSAGIARNAKELAKWVGVSADIVHARLDLALVPDAFLRCFGDQDRASKDMYSRLASLVGAARRAHLLADVLESLAANGFRMRVEGGGPGDVFRIVADLERVLDPDRRRGVLPQRRDVLPQPYRREPVQVTRFTQHCSPVATVSPDGKEVVIALGISLPPDQQRACAEVMADSAVEFVAGIHQGKEQVRAQRGMARAVLKVPWEPET